ncbi:MAG: METTL5 family protein [Candidatus Nanoarchaeia archaeon]
MSKKDLAVELSRLAVFDDAKLYLEQYSTDSEVAADILWNAHMKDLIKDKTIIDLGAGTGILGIGCLLLGAKRVIFVEKDKDCLDLLEQNLKVISENYEISTDILIENMDIKDITPDLFGECDLVVQNPPFGTQEKNCDALFLEKAMQIAPKVITMHKTVTKDFIAILVENNGFKESNYFYYKYPLKMTLPHHKKSIEHIKVSCWFLERKHSN